MTLQSFEPGQIVYEEQSHNLTDVSFHLVVRTSAHSVWLRPIGKTETELGNGQGSVLPDNPTASPGPFDLSDENPKGQRREPVRL